MIAIVVKVKNPDGFILQMRFFKLLVGLLDIEYILARLFIECITQSRG